VRTGELSRAIPFDGPAFGEGFVTVRIKGPTGRMIDESMLVELVKLVTGNDWPPTWTVAPVTNPEPVMEMDEGFPAITLDGVREDKTGTRFWSKSWNTFEIPAEGDGFWTVIPTLPAGPVKSEAKMDADNCVELTNWVTLLMLFQ
jgi:hypothetical protein